MQGQNPYNLVWNATVKQELLIFSRLHPICFLVLKDQGIPCAK